MSDNHPTSRSVFYPSNCEWCEEKPATLVLTITIRPLNGGPPSYKDHKVCEPCARASNASVVDDMRAQEKKLAEFTSAGLYQFSEKQKSRYRDDPTNSIIWLIRAVRADTGLSLRSSKALFDKSRHLLEE